MWQCKWCHLVAKFETNASGAIWWPNLQLKQMAASGGQTCNQCKWCHVVAKFNPSHGDNFWVRCASGNVSLCDPVCWSIKIDFCVTQMMLPIFVVCGQKFGALSLLRCPSPKRPQIQPVRQKMAHWAVKWALSRKAKAFKVLSGYGCDMFPQICDFREP